MKNQLKFFFEVHCFFQVWSYVEFIVSFIGRLNYSKKASKVKMEIQKDV
jgi:hypothetical protein